jgi:hypothetical protein
VPAFLAGIGRSAAGEGRHAALKRGLSGSALVSGPVVSRRPLEMRPKKTPSEGLASNGASFSGGRPYNAACAIATVGQYPRLPLMVCPVPD